MKLYKTLLEAVQHAGVRQIASQDGWDIYAILTWDGAQQFVARATNAEAGTQWVQNETTFNNQIRDGQYSFFLITETDQNQAVLGVVRDAQGHIDIEDDQRHAKSTEDYPTIPFDLIINFDEHHALPNIAAPQETIPDEEDAQDAVADTSNNTSDEAEESPTEETQDVATDTTPTSHETSNTSRRYEYHQDSDGRLVILDADTGELVKFAGEDSWRTPAIKYKRVKDHIRIIGIRTGEGTIRIPDEIDGLPVTEIAPYSVLRSHYSHIYLPRTVKEIPPFTFAGREFCNSWIHVAQDAKLFKNSMADGTNIRFRKDVN